MSPLAHINYTRRRRIRKQDVRIAIAHDGDGPPRFTAELSLGGYGLPEDAHVYVEAYRGASWQRFCFGQLSAPRPAGETTLEEFGTADGVRFRVKVVEPSVADGGAPARLLARVDGLVPRLPEGPARSLLPVAAGEFADEVWQLQIDEGDGPVLMVSRELAPDRAELVRSPPFVTLCLPEILREILRAACAQAEEDPALPEDGEHWVGLWLRFANTLAGPHPEQRDRLEEWIDDVVAAFCRRNAVADHFRRWWGEEGE